MSELVLPVLSLIVFIPVVAAVIILFLNGEQRDQEPVLSHLLGHRESVGILLGVPDAQGKVPAFVGDPGPEIQILARQGEGGSQPFEPFPILPGSPVRGQVVAIPLFGQLSPVFIERDPRELLRS